MSAEEPLDDDIKPPGNNKLILIIVAVNVVALGGIGAFIFLGGGGDTAEAADVPAEEMEVSFEGPPTLVSFDPFIVNLNEPSASRYLKLSLSIEVPGDKAVEAVEGRKAPIRHVVLSYLAGLSFSDTQGAEAKQMIQEALTKQMNESLKKDVVKQVYFTEFVIQ